MNLKQEKSEKIKNNKIISLADADEEMLKAWDGSFKAKSEKEKTKQKVLKVK